MSLNLKTAFKYLAISFLVVPVLSFALAVFNFTYKNFEHWYFRNIVGQSVVKIFTFNGSGRAGGTGFQVEAPDGRSYTVTNSHVCGTAPIGGIVTIIHQDGAMRFRKILKKSEHTDLCLIEPSKDLPSLKIATGHVVGEPIRTIGHPAMGPLVMLSGEIIGKTWYPLGVHGEPANMIMTSVFAIPGSSGSPVINVFGRVAGVVFATRNTDNTWWAYAVPSEDLLSFLEQK